MLRDACETNERLVQTAWVGCDVVSNGLIAGTIACAVFWVGGEDVVAAGEEVV